MSEAKKIYPDIREVTELVCDGRKLPDIQAMYEAKFKVTGFSCKWLYVFNPFSGPEYYFTAHWPCKSGKHGVWRMSFLYPVDFAYPMDNIANAVMRNFKNSYDRSQDSYKMSNIDQLP